MFPAQIFARTLVSGKPDTVTPIRSGHRNIFAFLQDRPKLRVFLATRVTHDAGVRPIFTWTGDPQPRISFAAYGTSRLPFPLPFIRTRRTTTTYRVWLFASTSASARRFDVNTPRAPTARVSAQRLILRSFKPRTKRSDMGRLHTEITGKSKDDLASKGEFERFLHRLVLAERT